MNIEQRLKDRVYNLFVDAGLVLELDDAEWQALCDLYASRGEGEPKTPVFNGIPLIRKAAD